MPWSSNCGHNDSFTCASGSGSAWLQLTNGVNSGSSTRYQSVGIERSIATMDGATYTLSLDYAGALGLATANTRIGVYVDGVQVGSYAGTSSNTALNWEELTFSFKGNGKPRSVRIQLEGGTDISTARGAMIDALKVVETLPSSANVAYGFVNGTVALPVIGSRLADGDVDARLKTEIAGLPVGSVLSDGVRQVKVVYGMGPIDVSAWNLARLVVTPPRSFAGTIRLQVRATSTELSNASNATVSRDIALQILTGSGCATPAILNPLLNFVNDTAVAVAPGSFIAVAAGALAPTAASASIFVPGSALSAQQQAAVTEESMESWLQRMSRELVAALQSKMAGGMDEGD